MKINLHKRRKEKGYRIFNMKYLNLCSSTPKINKDNKNKSLLNDSNLILDDNKQASIQLNSDQNFFYRNNNSKKEESDKENESLKFLIKKGILIKNSSISKTNSQYGSFMKNSQNKLSPYKTLKINLHKGLNNLQKCSPINNIKKIKWNQYGILNLSKKTFKKKKINLNFMNNASNIEAIKYKKKIKGINSSFSPKSSFYNEQKLLNDYSSKNFLFNKSIFSDSHFLDSPKSQKSIIVRKKNNSSDIKKFRFNNIIIPRKNIYQLVLDHGLIGKIETFKGLPDDIKKMNNKSIKILEIDNQKLFNKYYCIVEPNKFKERFQNPFTSPFEKKIYDIEKQKQEENKNYINEEVFNSSIKLIKDMTNEINRYSNKNSKYLNISDNIIDSKNKKHSPLLEKFKRIIINLSKYLSQITVSISEILTEYQFVKVCFTYNETKDLLYAIKAKKIDICNKILDNNKHIVLDYDYYYLTPLHWAVKKNLYQIVPKLIEYGSIVDSKNFIEETPLHIGIKINSYECVSLLLVNLASPFSKNKDGKKPIELTNDFQMKILLDKITTFYYLSLFKKTSEQLEYIQKHFTLFIVNEFSTQLDNDILLYFKEKKKRIRYK